jgi:hypothetical protein
MMLRTLTAACWAVASMPATLAHEVTHWLVSLPWSEQSAVIHDGSGFVHGVEWSDETPAWAVVLTSIAPTILGSVVGCVGLYRLLTAPPPTTRAWLVSASIAGWWVIYVCPSADDLDFSRSTADDTSQETQNNG